MGNGLGWHSSDHSRRGKLRTDGGGEKRSPNEKQITAVITLIENKKRSKKRSKSPKKSRSPRSKSRK